jgi:hypothetical protein
MSETECILHSVLIELKLDITIKLPCLGVNVMAYVFQSGVILSMFKTRTLLIRLGLLDMSEVGDLEDLISSQLGLRRCGSKYMQPQCNSNVTCYPRVIIAI